MQLAVLLSMSKTPSINATQAREMVRRGRATLVCAYEDEDKCHKIQLEDSLTLRQFLQTADDRDRRDDIIFYCA